MPVRRYVAWFFLLFALLSRARLQAQTRAQTDPVALGLPEMARLDTLPRFKSSVRVASVSSYDRTGGNDDGFSGKYSFIRKEGKDLVIADLQGPGVIYRIWTPTPTDDPIAFYFDGEATPRFECKYRELFDGSKPPFLAPLVGFGSGGFYSYLPLPYKTSCKILIRAPKVQFYQINYATYAPETPLTSFSPTDPLYAGKEMESARTLLGRAGEDLSARVVPEGTKLQTTKVRQTLPPGGSIKLFETHHPGRIAGLRLFPASAFSGKERAILLKIYWDGSKTPAVLCPVGDFFGYAWGEPAMRSLLLGTDFGIDYCYFPMPYDHSARIELVSDKPDGVPLQVQAEIVVADLPRRPDEGRFAAIWRREAPTTKGAPFNYVEAEGQGHLVGVTLQAQGAVPGITPFFEGDDLATLDGELSVHGTGSEDFFNGGWYDVPGRWEARASYPLSGCLEYNRAMARSGGYRLFLTDAYAFRRSLKLDMEHAPEKNDTDADYVGVSYLYLAQLPAAPPTLPELAARQVADPARLVFFPGWYVPIHAFSMQNASLVKKTERLGTAEHQILSLQTSGENMFGEHLLSFLCKVPAAGRYHVFIDAVTGPLQGQVRLFQNEHAAGAVADLYASERALRRRIDMGTLDMQEGSNQVFFKLVGKNEKASGMNFDIVILVLEKAQ